MYSSKYFDVFVALHSRSLSQWFVSCVTSDVVIHVAYACIWKPELIVWRREFSLMIDMRSIISLDTRTLYPCVMRLGYILFARLYLKNSHVCPQNEPCSKAGRSSF